MNLSLSPKGLHLDFPQKPAGGHKKTGQAKKKKAPVHPNLSVLTF